MSFFQAYSNKNFICCSNKFDSFVELVNNTDFDFDYVDKFGYQVYFFKDLILLIILI